MKTLLIMLLMIGVDARTKENLSGVAQELAIPTLVAYHTCSTPFVVIDGLRTPQEQQQHVDNGVSWTLNSKHLTGHAIDFVPKTFDWNDVDAFEDVYECTSSYSSNLIWGGNWKQRDYGHIELIYTKG